jgi:hypothetical protein
MAIQLQKTVIFQWLPKSIIRDDHPYSKDSQ